MFLISAGFRIMEDDTELKDLLVQALEAKGCLAKLRVRLIFDY